MPRSASWLGNHRAFDFLEYQLASTDYVLRADIESLFGVSKRRAQQLMKGLPGKMGGTAFMVERDALLKRLKAIAAGEPNTFETDRRARFASKLDAMRRERIEQPQLLVEAPTAVVNTRLEQLPAGVTIEHGRITVSFRSATQACERLLALAMAIGNDPDKFSQLVEGA